MEKIINELRYFDKKFPQETLIEAIKRKDEITPILLEELDTMIEHPEIVIDNPDYVLHTYAIYLFAQFKEKRAFTRIIDLISFTPDEVDIIFGDILTEGIPAILYSTFDGNLSLLQSIIENPSIDIYVRGGALDVYGKLYADGIMNKEKCISYLRKLIYDNYNDWALELATDIQGVVVERHLFEMIDDIQYLYDQNYIDTQMFGHYDDFIDSIYLYEYERDQVRYIDDIIKEMSGWHCFEQTEDEKRKKKDQMKKLEESILQEGKKISQIIEKPKKIGRNDPCPCGSGKKYKRCCLGKETTSEAKSKKLNIESAEQQKTWLKYYPKEDGERKADEVSITDVYDRESIAIDNFVYLALHHRAIPIWVQRDQFEEEILMISYLLEAFENFLSKCEKEGITSFDEYDSKHKIHYRSEEWIKKLDDLIVENDLEYDYYDSWKKINQIIVEFS